MNVKQDVEEVSDRNAVILYDQTNIPLNERRYPKCCGWAINKIIVGLQRANSSISALRTGAYMENVELYSIKLDVDQPLQLHGNIVLRDCTLTMRFPIFVAAKTTLKMEHCTIDRSTQLSHHLLLKISHHARCVILNSNVWKDMDHIFRIYPDSTYDGYDHHMKRCEDECDSALKILECTNNVIKGLRGKQAFLGCPPEYCHHINFDFVREVKGNHFEDDGIDGAEQNAIFAGDTTTSQHMYKMFF
ncbi:MAG: hypothetical protein HRU26_08075 [Psychroserpens sp.]|nr:hypothetical protein [Psychroserpens sp.]